MTKLALDTADVDLSFHVNEDYARRYEERKRKQELGQLEDKYKAKLKQRGAMERAPQETHNNDGALDSEDLSESDSESDEEEDEDGEQLTPAVDVQILKTLSDIRSKSDRVYDPQTRFFDEREAAQISAKWRTLHGATEAKRRQERALVRGPETNQAITLKDLQRERLLRGEIADSDEDASGDEGGDQTRTTRTTHAAPLPHAQEQELLREEMRRAFGAGEGDETHNPESGEYGNLLSRRVRTEEEVAREEEEYRTFLLENLGSGANVRESMSEWIGYRDAMEGRSARKKSARELNDDEFLMDYVLHKGWIDKKEQKLPSYDEVIAEASEDEAALDQADSFESAHNFRYEQEGGAHIQTYSRQVEGSMRREESKRKRQRQSAQERKEAEKTRKREELKRLKNLKTAEIRERLAKIQRAAALVADPSDAVLAELDNNEFDPERHDRMMDALLQDAKDDEERPVFSSDSELDRSDGEETVAVKTATKALKRAVKRVDGKKSDQDRVALETEKSRLAHCLDELYAMDYEDLIGGDIPCRFKYQRVEPCTFGLKVADILTADDSVLNQHVSLKKLAPYRPHEQQRREASKYSARSRLREFHAKVREQARREREARREARGATKS